MTEVTTEERGRITLPKELRERFGDQYRIVELEDGIKLLPRPRNPIEALRGAASEEFKAASMSRSVEIGIIVTDGDECDERRLSREARSVGLGLVGGT